MEHHQVDKHTNYGFLEERGRKIIWGINGWENSKFDETHESINRQAQQIRSRINPKRPTQGTL